MLTRVFDCLSRQGWFDGSRPFEQTVNFTRGAAIWLLLTRDGVPDTYVKCSEHISLQAEAARYAEASRCHPLLVPRFVGYQRHGGLEVLVCEAVDSLGLNTTRMKTRQMLGRVLDGMDSFFASSLAVKLPLHLTPLPNAEVAVAMQPYFDVTPQAALVRRWLKEETLAWIARQPEVPQHGDLMLNNLGLRDDHSLVVFDWEDFGLVCLPGLDLFTLELSLAGGVAALLNERRQAAGRLHDFVSRSCGAIDLPAAEYRAMTGVYALVFRYMKRNYGPGVRARMDELLLALDSDGGVA